MIKWYFRKLLPVFVWILIVCEKLNAAAAHGDTAIATAAVDAINDEDVQVNNINLFLDFHLNVFLFLLLLIFRIFQTNFK